MASISAGGAPHVSPLWFLWHDGGLWLNSVVRSQRWRDLERDPRISAVIDAGEGFAQLRGVELSGRVRVIGDVPRTSTPDAELAEAERRYAEKYAGSSTFTPDGRHAWLRLEPERIVSWDYSKTRPRS